MILQRPSRTVLKTTHMATQNPPKVIILGAGFAGLFAARTLATQPVEVLIIDRQNFHTFTPLLYQVATCALDPSEITYPVRTIFRDRHRIRFLLGKVTAVQPQEQVVTLFANGRSQPEHYDYLIVATGSTPTYFGNNRFQTHSLELRTLSDGVRLRNHVLKLFEKAAWTEDVRLRQALTTIVVVGGGPTGLETAGAIYELYNYVLDKEYGRYQLQTRVILVEMLPHLLAPYPDTLRQAALQQLKSIGVEVLLERRVTDVSAESISLDDGTVIPTHTLIWAAGVKASPVADLLGVPLARGGRVPIDDTTAVKGLTRVYAAGDIAHLEDAAGEPYPMVIPVAQQQGILAAKNILAHLKGQPAQPFHFLDRGMMATIGRRRAVALLYNRLPLRGYIAWLVWLLFHLITLMGFRNRLSVLVSWVWNYFTYDRSVRIILEQSQQPPAS